MGLVAQAAGIRYIGFRNEQAAGFAAAASGFLTGVPGVLLTVSGPGALNGIPGLAHATVNTWPLLQISGSAEQVHCLPLGPNAFSGPQCLSGLLFLLSNALLVFFSSHACRPPHQWLAPKIGRFQVCRCFL